MNKAAFIVRFLAVFALVILVGWVLQASRFYARTLAETARIISPLLTGWWLEERASPTGSTLWFRAGDSELKLLLNLESLSLGLLPFLALISATPGISMRRWLIAALWGVLAFFALHLIVLLVYPLLVSRPDYWVTDITGQFLGLLTFVGAPIILWFALTFNQLRSVWRLN